MKKKVYLYAGAGVIVLAAIVVAVFLMLNTGRKPERSAKVLEISGRCFVERSGKAIDVSEGMQLLSEDILVADKGSSTRIRIDEDKYIYLNENSRLSLKMTGTTDESKTMAFLEEGSMLTEVKRKLSAGSSYLVVTPNTSMDIHGTKTLTEVYKDVLGAIKTNAAVVEGQVNFKAIKKDSTGKTVTVSTELTVGTGLGVTTDPANLLSLEEVTNIAEDGKTPDGEDAAGVTPEGSESDFELPSFSEDFLTNAIAVLAKSRDGDVDEGFVAKNVTEEELSAAINVLNDVIVGKTNLPASVEKYLISSAQSYYNEPVGDDTPEGRNANAGQTQGQGDAGVITGQNNTGNIGGVAEPESQSVTEADYDDDDDDYDSGNTPTPAPTPNPTPAPTLYEVGTRIDLYYEGKPVGNAASVLSGLAAVEVSGLTNGKAAAGTTVTISVNEMPGVQVNGIQISETGVSTGDKTLSFNMPDKAVHATVSIEVKNYTVYGWDSSIKGVAVIDGNNTQVIPGTRYSNAQGFIAQTSSAVSSVTVTKIFHNSDNEPLNIAEETYETTQDPTKTQWTVEDQNWPIISIRANP